MDLIERVKKVLVENLEECTTMENVGPDEDLSTYGVSSISFMKIVIALEMEFDIEWDDEDLDVNNFSTINNILGYISKTAEA